jgi:hypothetical protein
MNPLDNLQDIHTPAEIGLWPVAYGWWILALVTIIFIGMTVKWLIGFYRKRKNKKLALQALSNINDEQNNGIMQINQLLKRVSIMYFPNVSVQQLYGNRWAEFLAQALSDSQAIKLSAQLQNLQDALYRRPDDKTLDLQEYKSLASTWIKQAVPPSNKTKQKLEQNYA